jgi:hypothetical protein
MADIALYVNAVDTMTPPKRVAADALTVVAPISHIIEGDIGIADKSAASVYIGIPHKFTTVDHVSVTPLTSFAITAAAYVIHKDYVQGPLAIGANYVAEALTLTLHADSPADADTYNNFYIKINTGANAGEIRKILDYASDVATLDYGFDAAMTSATETYTILGTALFCVADPVGGVPNFSISITGKEQG